MTRAAALRMFELDDGRTRDEMRVAHRQVTNVCLPAGPAGDPGLRAKADRRLQEINCSYAVLQDGAETVEPLRQPAPPPHAATPRSLRAPWSLALLVIVGLLAGAAVVGIVVMVVGPTQQAPAPRPIS